MLKKLVQFQLIGLSFIWIFVGFNLYSMKGNEVSETAALVEVKAVETEQTAEVPEAKKETPVATIPRIEPTVVSKPKTEKITFPVAGYDEKAIISFFGDKRGKSRLHKGVDIKAPRHTPLLAVADGKIEKLSNSGSAGKAIYLKAADGKRYFYAHLEDWLVAENDIVKAGQEIGTVGDSGNAKGTTPHLHFEVLAGKKKRSLDPLPFLNGEPLP